MMIERKFKVGDRVRVSYSSIHPSKGLYELRGYSNDEPAVVSKVDKDDPLLTYFVKFDKPMIGSDLQLWVSEGELELDAPAVPDGWTPASEPPDNYRDMRVMLNDGEKRFGWYIDNALPGGEWYLYPKGTTLKSIDDTFFDDTPAAPGEVIAWREIEPEPKAWYIVSADLPTHITVWHNTLDEALTEAQRLCVKQGRAFHVLKVVAEVNPGKPEVIRMDKE